MQAAFVKLISRGIRNIKGKGPMHTYWLPCEAQADDILMAAGCKVHISADAAHPHLQLKKTTDTSERGGLSSQCHLNIRPQSYPSLSEIAADVYVDDDGMLV